MQAGFEWFVAWRYLRSRGRRASVMPMIVGVFLVAVGGGAFALAAFEPARSPFRFGSLPDWRHVGLALGALGAVLGLGFALFGGARRLTEPPVLHAHDDHLQAHRRSAWPAIGGALLLGAALFVVVQVVRDALLVTVPVYDLLPELMRGDLLSLPPPSPAEHPRTVGALGDAAMALVAAAAVAVTVAIVRLVRPRRASAGAIAGPAGPAAAAVLLVVFGLAFQFAGGQPEQLAKVSQVFALVNWSQIWMLVGLVALAFGVLVAVFGFFYRLQTIFTTISCYGVFLGTWALVVALSVMNGFEVDLRQKILGQSAHVLVARESGSFQEWRAVEQRLDGVPGVVATTPYKQSEVVIAANSNYNGVIIKGIDPRSVARVTDLQKNLQHEAKLEQLWPLAPDGGVLPYVNRPDVDVGAIDPGDAPPPDDDGDGPPDFSGDDEVGAPAGSAGRGAGEGSEPAFEDDGEAPPDFSGDDEVGAPAGSAGRGAGEGSEPAFEDDADEAPPDFSGEVVGRSSRSPRQGEGLLDLPPRDQDILDLEIPDVAIIESGSRRRKLDPRVAQLDGILVGRELAKNLHLYVGQEVQVVSPIGQDTPAGQMPRVRNFRVAGIFFSGMYEYDTKYAYVTLPALQSFLSLGDEVDGIEIKVEDADDTDTVVGALAARLGDGYEVKDWKSINRSLFSALKLEKIAMFLVLTIIILVASFSIISNLIMIVVEKAKEIAILKALGASDSGVMRVFMIEGLYIGMLGTGFGIALGVGTCLALDIFGLPLDPDVYYIDKLPVAMDAVSITLVALAGVAISFVATIYPSWVGARLRPVDGLRYE